MARTIWRYDLAITDTQIIHVPAGATFLQAARREGRRVESTHRRGLVHDAVEVWALVDPTAPRETRLIRIAGTGGQLPDDEDLDHLGTVQIEHGLQVYHVFEVLSAAAERRQPAALAAS